MGMIKKSITVTDQQEKWIQAQIATGQYASDSEVVREALREKQMRMTETEVIRSKLARAEQSGFVDKTQDELLKDFKEKARLDGKI